MNIEGIQLSTSVYRPYLNSLFVAFYVNEDTTYFWSSKIANEIASSADQDPLTGSGIEFAVGYGTGEGEGGKGRQTNNKNINNRIYCTQNYV